MENGRTVLRLPLAWRDARQALTSVPWPADRSDVPAAIGISTQAVPLFEPHLQPRLRRYLMLCAAEQGLPPEIAVSGSVQAPPDGKTFSDIHLVTLRENLTKGEYVYRENEARLTLTGREIGLRMGMVSRMADGEWLMVEGNGAEGHQPSAINHSAISWWQWCGVERLWSGPLAEAWRVGGSLLPYPTNQEGGGRSSNLLEMADRIVQENGDCLHGELFVIVWKSGCIQITAHFRAGYFHNWPKPIPAFPVIHISGLKGLWPPRAVEGAAVSLDGGSGDTLDLSPSSLMFTNGHAGLVYVEGHGGAPALSAEKRGQVSVPPLEGAVPPAPRPALNPALQMEGSGLKHGFQRPDSPPTEGLILQPWQDLRVLANKTREDRLVYLDPALPEVMPAGVSRTFMFNIGLNGASPTVARYQVPPAWYKACGVIETDRPGPAAEMAARSLALIKEHTQRGGFDTGFVWRYLRRDLRSGVPEEDGAEWEGNLAQAMFTLAYQCGEDPASCWELYLHHAHHAADIAVYHGSWMGRLEASASFTAPLPKCRFGGPLFAYLETGDPYLLELCHSMAGVYMAMEWSRQPRYCMGRDAYPLTSFMALWDYSAEALYLDFARQTAIRLIGTQMDDGGFSGQAAAGRYSGVACLTGLNDIGFGSGLLAPIALLEWAARDFRWPSSFIPRLRRWADLMLRLQTPDGIWLQAGTRGNPYPLIGSGALFSLIKAGAILADSRCIEAVRRFLDTMNAQQGCVAGTHSFLSALYAHVADAALRQPTTGAAPKELRTISCAK